MMTKSIYWNGLKVSLKIGVQIKVKSVCSYNTHGMGKFDGIGVSEVTDIRDWVAYVAELTRHWNKYTEYLEFYPGI